MTGVGIEREYERNGVTTKLNVISLEADGHKVQCTLFGSYVDDLNNFLATGEIQNVVVIVQFGKVKTFQDKIHIQNCINCSRLVFNSNCQDAVQLRNRLTSNGETPSPVVLTQLTAEPRVQLIDEFLYNGPRATIQALKDCFNETTFVVLATIKRIVNEESWYYATCLCTKAVYPDSQMYFCEKCDKHVMKVCPRFCLKLRVMENTDSAVFVLFDRNASLLSKGWGSYNATEKY